MLTLVELGLLDSDFNNQLSQRYFLRLFLFTVRVPGTEPGYFLTKGVKVRMIVRWYQTVPTQKTSLRLAAKLACHQRHHVFKRWRLYVIISSILDRIKKGSKIPSG